MKNNITELTRRDILISEQNAVLTKATKLDIDITVLERTDPELTVAREQMAQVGNTASFREVKAKEMLEKYRHDREGLQKRLDVITLLLKEI
jgi:hypothetical protein